MGQAPSRGSALEVESNLEWLGYFMFVCFSLCDHNILTASDYHENFDQMQHSKVMGEVHQRGWRPER